MASLLAFTLDHQPVQAAYEPGMSLLDVLRESCGVTVAKDGCSQGACGACAVVLDGNVVLACQTPPEKAEGKVVTTVAGIPEHERELLAEAFAREGAVQCGFCTPGFVLHAKALLDDGKGHDRAALAKGLGWHVCRCTGYHSILAAIESVADVWPDGELPAFTHSARIKGEVPIAHRPEPIADNPAGDGVGEASPRYQARELALGERPFIADMTRPDMLHAAVVLSEHPRARIEKIDTAAASAIPGVVRILLAEDIPGKRVQGHIIPDWPVMVAVGEEARYVGDVLAVVVADTQHHARQAADAVQVEAVPLAPVTTVQEAFQDDAPRLHERGNLLSVTAYARGDVKKALADCPHVLTEEFSTQRIEHAFLEPEACLAEPRDGGLLHVYSQGQGVHEDHRQIVSLLGLPDEAVTVELVPTGGAFGGKEDMLIQGHAALAAHLLQRPVRLVLTREQSLRMHPKRHPLWMTYTVGMDVDGSLQAVIVDILGDTGAYASVGMKVLERAAGHACGPYNVPNVQVTAKAAYTNNPPCGAMRGFGVNQTAFAIEGMLDRLGEKLGIDGYTLRHQNILREGDPFATGQIMGPEVDGLRRSLEAVRDVYESHPRAGIACGIKNTGIGNGLHDTGRVLIRVLPGEGLHIATGFTEMGQGLFTILRQVVSEETGLPVDVMDVQTVSDPRVLCGMTTASRATALTTKAGQQAAQKLAAALRENPLSQLVGQDFLGEFICDVTVPPDADVPNPRTHMTFGFATQVVLLDEAGKLERVVAAHDVGRAINPLNCVGQIEGAVHMGLGYALTEDFPCTDGRPDSLRFRDLGILRAKDTPPVDVLLIEEPDGLGGYGSKGVGEIGLVPTAAAVAGALHRFDGSWYRDLPMVAAPAAGTLVPKSRRP